MGFPKINYKFKNIIEVVQHWDILEYLECLPVCNAD